MLSRIRGQRAESFAKKYLKSHKISIISENFKIKIGEIDCIGLDQNTQELVFFEIKYRSSIAYGHPLEILNSKQIHRIHMTAEYFLKKHSQYKQYPYRFDYIALWKEDKFKKSILRLKWIRSAF